MSSEAIVAYKNRVASRLFALAREQINERVPDGVPMHLSAKLDGHFSGLWMKGGTARFFNRTGKELMLPKLAAAAQKLLPADIILAGELHVVLPGGRARSFHVSEAVADENRHDLRFAAFDMIGSELDLDVALAKIAAMLPAEGKIHALPQQRVETRREITDAYERHVDKQGLEGVVVRSADRSGWKIKTKHTFDAAVIGFCEGSGDQTGLLRSILVGLMQEDGSWRVLGKAGTGFSKEQRAALLTKFRASVVPSTYVEVSEKQTAYEMIHPEHVCEIACIDMLTDDGGLPIRKPVITYTTENGWSTGDLRAAVNLIAPVFLRLRDDKTVTADDVRFSQLTDLVELDAAATAADLARSTLLRREVYVKETKGEKAVRKLLAWKTNKEASGDYPAFVFALTDYSAGRAEPLKQDIAIAPTEEGIMAIFDDQLVENVKKGWNRV
jgi:ATP-dependent DNA ligase